MSTKKVFAPKHKSKEISEGAHRVAARAMLPSVGLDEEALNRPFIGMEIM